MRSVRGSVATVGGGQRTTVLAMLKAVALPWTLLATMRTTMYFPTCAAVSAKVPLVAPEISVQPTGSVGELNVRVRHAYH